MAKPEYASVALLSGWIGFEEARFGGTPVRGMQAKRTGRRRVFGDGTVGRFGP